MIGVIQPPAAVGRDGHNVLDPNPEPACEIDSRFHREAHAWHERLLFTLDHVRRLVSGDSDPMTGAMNELLAVSRLRDHLPGGPVNFLATHAGPYRIDTGLLRLPNDLVDLTNLRSWFSDANRARGIGPIAVSEPTKVQDDRVTGLDHPVPRLMMRIGPIGTRPDDGEVDLFVSELSQQI